jgi:hypothetical protein
MRHMVPGSASTALLKRQAMTPAAIAAIGVALGLYQATSLTLGPQGEREIQLSLATPASLDLSLPAPPAIQVLEVGQAVAGRVERSLVSFAVLTSQPVLTGRIGVKPAASAAVLYPAPSATPSKAPAVVPAPISGPARHSATGGHPGSGVGTPAHPVRPAGAGTASQI